MDLKDVATKIRESPFCVRMVGMSKVQIGNGCVPGTKVNRSGRLVVACLGRICNSKIKSSQVVVIVIVVVGVEVKGISYKVVDGNHREGKKKKYHQRKRNDGWRKMDERLGKRGLKESRQIVHQRDMPACAVDMIAEYKSGNKSKRASLTHTHTRTYKKEKDIKR